MSTNGQHGATSLTDSVLRWPQRVVAVADLRQRLNGHRELLVSPGTVVTPLALEELRTQGIHLRQEEPKPAASATGVWGYGQDRTYALVPTAARAVQREGLALKELAANPPQSWEWARAIAECIARADYLGGVLFCDNPALVCCVANKCPGLRAAVVATVSQASQALTTFAPNLVVVEMPGRTFFEIRQILRMCCQAGLPRCPDSAAGTLQKLDGHAHR